ncbi:Fe(3+) ions import ATP-binding protein FbpC [Bacteroidia bacterium]|nr:Fe(3+) ions import ATP-binding protein FbpC [Bacteroidia bacterium]
MSVSVTCDRVVKKYGDAIIIPDLSLNIHNGEFFTLLGPSGCGKTTLLRMMIGFNSIEGGAIKFDNRIINDMPVSKRNVGMVFQNYAIFPHMSTFNNVAFGLKNRKIPKAKIEKRVDEILKIVHIQDLRDRMPDRMSGGQQQRIALARAIVIEPDLLLMDEPLSNLDAKLRIETRDAIKNIQSNIGITTVYVTHDQEEALAVSDRIAVMKDGVIQQVGTPKDIYNRPANRFVATFIGRSNIIEAKLITKNLKRSILFQDGFIASLDTWNDEALSLPDESSILISIRPEEFIIRDTNDGFGGIVRSKTFLGPNTYYNIETSYEQVLEIIQTSDELHELKKDDPVNIDFAHHKINVFNADGSKNLLLGVDSNE